MSNNKTSTKNLVKPNQCSNRSGINFPGKFFFTLCLLCLAIAPAFAQRPEAGDMAFTFGINGLSNIGVSSNFGDMGTLLYRYYLTDDIAARARLDLTLSNNKSDFGDDTSGAGEHDVTKTHTANIHLGLQKNFGTLKHIEPYIAGDIMFGFGKQNIQDNLTNVDKLNSVEVKIDPGNTTTFGVVIYGGFHYFFTDHLGLGAEFGYGIQHSSTGEGTTTIITKNGIVSTTTTTHTGTSKSFSLSGTGGEGLIMFTVAFGK